MYYNIFLDDERAVNDVKWVDLPLVNWFIARNYDDFVRIISENGLPERISFDSDLSPEHYDEYFWANNPQNVQSFGKMRYEKMEEKTGYDCALWLAEYCRNKNLDLPTYYVHSMNHISKKDIENLFKNYEKSRVEI